jgi:hypothetical protein
MDVEPDVAARWEASRIMWSNVTQQIAAARQVNDPVSADYKRIGRQVTTTRFAIGDVAKEVIGPKVRKIECYHFLVGSSPPPGEIKRIGFNGISPPDIAILVRDQLLIGTPPDDVGKIVKSYFEKGRPKRADACLRSQPLPEAAVLH